MSGQTFNPSLVDDTPQFALMAHQQDEAGEVWAYVQADEALSATRVAVINTDGGAENIDTTANKKGLLLGVVRTAIASGKYGWISRKGQGNIRAKASCAANANIYTSSTSGVVDDTSSSQEHLQRMHLTTARGTGEGSAAALWEFPMCG